MHAPSPYSSARHYDAVGTAARVLGAGPHQLVTILFDELLLALAVGDKALARGDAAMVEAKRERAASILHALEASLDFDQGGNLAAALARVYREAIRSIYAAGQADPGGFSRAKNWVSEIADAWGAIGTRAA